MPYLNEAEFVLMGAQRLEKAIHPIPGETEDGVNAPFHQPLDDKI